MDWILVLFLFVGDKPNYETFVDKVAIPMKGPMEQYCRRDRDGNYVLKHKTEGSDHHKIYNQCVTVKQWRGE